jgi:very-short-patch-repair endonuclease
VNTALRELLNWTFGLAALVGLIAVAVAILKRRESRSGGGWPLYARRLLGEREQVLFWRLAAAFPNHVVLAQVSLSQLLGVKKHASNRQAISNRYRQLTADFVICKRSFEPIGVIELDGLSHDHPRRQSADERKAAALESAGVPLIRINVTDIPDEAELKGLFAA